MFWLQGFKDGQAPIKTPDGETPWDAIGRHCACLYFKWHAIEKRNPQHAEFNLLIPKNGFPVRTPRHRPTVFLIHNSQPVRPPE
jgi:hypothetical protein